MSLLKTLNSEIQKENSGIKNRLQGALYDGEEVYRQKDELENKIDSIQVWKYAGHQKSVVFPLSLSISLLNDKILKEKRIRLYHK